jgi:crotonobetainyl-CoA:carnitine CoA-transferase CaiB-like acyl-CoA transferase
MPGHRELLSDPRFVTLDDRLRNQEDLDRCVETWTCDQDGYELMDALQAAGVAAGVCQTAEDKCDRDPQLRHLKWLTELESTRLGRWPLPEIPIHMSETPTHVGGLTHRGAPLYGEDNVTILGELLGMSEEEVVKLTQEGVL